MVGCGDPSSIAEVTGTITSGGKPVSGVSVQFVPKDGKSPLGRGSADESGRYTIGRAMGKKGCAAGTYSVRLSEQDPGSQLLNIPEEMYDAVAPLLPKVKHHLLLPLSNRHPTNAKKLQRLGKEDKERNEIIYVWTKA